MDRGLMSPYVGQIVHYVSHGTPVLADGTQAYTAQCRAAIVTEVGDTNFGEDRLAVGLTVFNPKGIFMNDLQYPAADNHEGVLPGADPVGGSWHHLTECPSVPEEDRG
jgi:hypothetical protein